MRALTAAVLLALLSAAARAEILSQPPAAPDPARYYLFYEHGQIVEGSAGRPVSPKFGAYEYEKILDRLANEGFVVISEIRPANADPEASAEKLQGWVQEVLAAGVSPRHIVVVGASKGGVIALRAANRLHDTAIRYVILSGCFAPYAERPEYLPYGEILSIQDASDGLDIQPQAFLGDAARVPRTRIIVTHTGKGHGLLFTPGDEWVVPLVEWSGIGAPRVTAPAGR